tara:strand:- start:4069 stop:7944 length:3876 start_codon:yes stop_codon:yes gene_type:complete
MARKTLSIGKRTPKAATPVVETVSSSSSFRTSYSHKSLSRYDPDLKPRYNIKAEPIEPTGRSKISDSIDEGYFQGTVLEEENFASVDVEGGEARNWINKDRHSSEGMATQEVLEQDYLSRMGSNLKSTLGMMARGEVIAKTNTGALRAAEAGLVLENIAGGRDFHSVVGGVAPSPVSSIDIVTGEITGTSSYQIPESELNKAMHFMDNTLPEMMERGPGQRLNTNFQNSKAEEAHKLALQNAYAVIDNTVDKYYMSERARGSEVYGIRKEAAVAELHEYILNSDLAGRRGRILPTPNEMETAGLVPTPAMRGGKQRTAAWTNWEYDTELAKRGLTRDTLDGDNQLHQQLMGKGPSLNNLFSRVDWTGIERGTQDPLQIALTVTRKQEHWDRVNAQRTLIKDASELIRKDMITNRDESYGNRLRYTGLDDPYGEQAAAGDFRSHVSSTLSMVGMNEFGGAIPDSPKIFSTTGEKPLYSIDQVIASRADGSLSDKFKGLTDREVLKNINEDVLEHNTELFLNPIAKTGMEGTGSNSGGMYGLKENSDQEEAVQSMMDTWQGMVDAGTDGELASQILTDSTEAPSMRAALAPAGSDMAAYDAQVANSYSPPQGSPEWLKQREGLVTASLGNVLWKGKGDQRVAANLAERRLVNELLTGDAKEAALLRLDPSNAYTRMGNKFEDKARDTFLATEGKGLTFRDAFFTKNEDVSKVMGASPDGRLFNEDGSSAGLLELKFLGEGGMKKALQEYTPQMQIQMAMTKESQTHFYALDRETNEYEHHIVKADPKMQAELIKLGESAHALEGTIKNNMELQAMKTGYKGAKRVGTAASSAAGQTESFSNDIEAEAPVTSFGSASEGQGSGGGGASASVGGDVPGTGVGGGVDANTVKQGLPSSSVKPDQALKAAKSAEAKAARDAAKALKDLQRSAKSAASALTAGALSAAASGMDTVRLAGLSGLSTEAARGLEYAFRSDGMTPGDARSTILAAGHMRTQFNTDSQVGGAIGTMIENWASSGLQQKLGFTPQISDFKGRGTQDILATIQGWVGGLDAETKIQALTAINPAFEHMSVLGMSGSDVGSAVGYIDGPGIERFHYGAEGVKQELQTAGEVATAATGELGGAIAATADFVLGAKTLKEAAVKLLAVAALSSAPTITSKYGELVESDALGNTVFGAVDKVRALMGNTGAQERVDVLKAAAAIASATPNSTIQNGTGWSSDDLPTMLLDENLLSPKFYAQDLPTNLIRQAPGLSQGGKVENKTEVNVTNHISKDLISTTVDNNGDIEETSERSSGDA